MFGSYVPGFSVYLVLSLSTLEYIYCSFSWRVVWILTESWRQMFFLSSSVLTESLSNCSTNFLKWVSKSFSSVQFRCSVVSYSLRPHESQHARPPYPSPTPRVYPKPCPLCQWSHPTISFSVVPFSSCPQSFPTSEYFQRSQLSTSGGQSIGVSASTSVPPMNTQD